MMEGMLSTATATPTASSTATRTATRAMAPAAIAPGAPAAAGATPSSPSSSPGPAPAGLDFAAVLRTFDEVRALLPETPAWSYPLLDEAAGVEVVVKHENVQPTGAFKVRGGVALMAALSPQERSAGVVTASTGNHAQSLAWAGARRGVPVTVVMPTSAPARKIEAVRALGARVVVEGATMCDSLAHAEHLAGTGGLRLVSPGDEPAIVLGHATVYLELFLRHGDLRTLYVPAGSGSGAAGACLVRDALAPQCRVVAVQSASAPAAYRSWRGGEPVVAPCTTRVAGLAVGTGFALTQQVLRERLDDFLLVEDEDIQRAVQLMATRAHTLAEGAGAAALAGLMADAGRLERGGPCAVVCTGGNADDEELAGVSPDR